jgi:hypothetical protein
MTELEAKPLDPSDDVARFWSGAGVLFGFWILAGFIGFVALVLLAEDPVKPEPPLDRPRVEATLGKILLDLKPPAERYAKISVEIERMLASKQLTDDTLRQELQEALSFSKQVSVPHEYQLTALWLEGNPQTLTEVVPMLRVEALNDALTPGSSAEIPQSQPASLSRISFGSSTPINARWTAGEPLRLRFSLRDADGLQEPIVVGGDDLELAEDAPLPGAAILLLGEPRALTRGQGRYLVRARTQSNDIIVAPLLLLRAIGATQ